MRKTVLIPLAFGIILLAIGIAKSYASLASSVTVSSSGAIHLPNNETRAELEQEYQNRQITKEEVIKGLELQREAILQDRYSEGKYELNQATQQALEALDKEIAGIGPEGTQQQPNNAATPLDIIGLLVILASLGFFVTAFVNNRRSSLNNVTEEPDLREKISGVFHQEETKLASDLPAKNPIHWKIAENEKTIREYGVKKKYVRLLRKKRTEKEQQC